MKLKKINRRNSFWNKLFNRIEVGIWVRVQGKGKPTPVWCNDGWIGKVMRKGTDKYGIYWDVRFLQSDNPTMNEWEDYLTFRGEHLEVI